MSSSASEEKTCGTIARIGAAQRSGLDRPLRARRLRNLAASARSRPGNAHKGSSDGDSGP